MKRVFSLIVCFLLLTSMFTVTSFALTEKEVILELPGDDGTGYPVTGVSGNRYKNNQDATTLVVPENIIRLGDGVFSSCSKVNQIKLHSRIQVIGVDTFYNTAYYNNERNWENGVLYIGDCLIKADPEQIGSSYTVRQGTRLIADFAFEACTNLQQIVFPDTLQYIGKDAFANTKIKAEKNYENGLLIVGDVLLDCSGNNSETIVIPENIKIIADGAFANCLNMTEIEISDSVMYIGQDAFAGCANLKRITLGMNVKTIGRGPFDRCYALEEIYVASKNENFKIVDGVLYNKALTEVIRCPQRKYGNVVIPTSCYKINAYSFEDCESITSVSIPNGATFIGHNGFANCRNLQDIHIPTSMEYIAGYAFSECIDLKSATIPDNVYFLGDAVFQNCKALESIYIGNKVRTLGADLFQGCEKLNYVRLGDAIEKISATAFSETKIISEKGNYIDGMLLCGKCLINVDESVKECTIPSNVTIIADGAFKNAENLESVNISKTLEKFNYKAFCDILEIPIYYEGDICDFYERTNFDSKINLYTKDYYTCFWSVIAFVLSAMFLFIGMPLIFNLKYKKLYETEEEYDDYDDEE